MNLNPETGTPYTREQLQAAFDKVCDKTNWKNPINAECSRDEVEVTKSAIIFFTGSIPTYQSISDSRLKVTAAGYYLTIGS